MTPFPVSLFPAVAKTGSAGFVVAVLIGLALYSAHKATTPPPPNQPR